MNRPTQKICQCLGGIKGALGALLAIFALALALPANAATEDTIIATGTVVVKAGAGNESCPPANGVIDPGETVTVQITFKNDDNDETSPSDLTMTLGAAAADGILLSTSGAVSIGALAAGASVTKDFVLQAANTNSATPFFCGETITLRFTSASGTVDWNAKTTTRTSRLGAIVQQPISFSQIAAIPISDAPAAATASAVVVSGLTVSNHLNDAKVANVKVKIFGLTHSYTKDIDMVLTGPNGTRIMLMSDTGGVPGGTTAVTGIDLTFDDGATSNLPDGTQMVAGSFKPTDIEPIAAGGEISEVAGVYATSFASVKGINPSLLNGTWTLTVKDDQANDAGIINGGWTLEITEEAATCCIPGLPRIQDISAPQVTPEDTAITINFTVADDETPLANLTLEANSTNLTLVPIERIVFSGTLGARTVVVSPAPNQPITAASATTKITITVRDADQKTAKSEFVLTVNQVNDAPTISDIANVTTPPGTATADIPFTIGDVETAASSLSMFVNSSNVGLVPNANIVLGGSGANRTVKVTPLANIFGAAEITVGVVDALGATVSDKFVLSVASPGNPTISPDIASTNMNEGTSLTIEFIAADLETPNKTNLIVAVSSSNTTVVPNTQAGLNLLSHGGTRAVTNDATGGFKLVITPSGSLTAGQSQTATITLTVTDTDGRVGNEAFTLTVNGVDNPAVVGAIPALTSLEDTAVGATFTVADPDTTAITTVGTSSNQLLVQDGGILYSGTGGTRTVVIIPVLNASGTVVITNTITSGAQVVVVTNHVTFIPVNDLPGIANVPALLTIPEDVNSGNGTNIVFTLSDVETAVLNFVNGTTVTASSSDTNVVDAAGLTFDASVGATRTLTVKPKVDANGKTFITITATDRGAADNGVSPGATTVTMELRVTSISDGPTLVLSAASGTTAEDTAFVLTATVGDIEGTAGGVILSFASTNTTLVPVANIKQTAGENTAVRTLSVLPGTNESGGPVTIQIIATSGTTGLKRTNDFAITVTPVADAPTISNIADQTIFKNSPLAALGFTVTDPEGFSIAPSATGLTGTSSDQTRVLDSNIFFSRNGNSAAVTIIPENNAIGATTITVTVRSADNVTAQDSFVLTIVDRNSPPSIGTIANQTVQEDTITPPLAFTVTDLEDIGNLDLITLKAESSDTALVPVSNIFFGGALGNRTVRIVPAPNASGVATITILATDSGTPAPAASNRTSFTITVVNVPDFPAINNISDVSTNEDSVVNITLTVSDAETPSSNLVVTATSSAQGVVANSGLLVSGTTGNRTLTITPIENVPNLLGSSVATTITVTVKDSDNLTTSDTFVLTLNAVNDKPFITDIPDQQINEDGNTGYILFTARDNEDIVILATKSSNTNLVPDSVVNIEIINTNHTTHNKAIKVTPVGNQSGVTTITLFASDPQLSTNSDTFVVTVGAVNDLPNLTNNNGNQVVPEDTVLNLAINVSDVETAQSALVVTATSSNTALVPNANIVITPTDNASRTVRITPINDGVGVTTITISVKDADNGEKISVFTAEWFAANDNPTITAITDKNTAEDSPTAPIPFTVGDIETDPANLIMTANSSDPVRVPIQNVEFSGTGPNRFVVVRPALDATTPANTSITITLTVTDGNGGTATSAFKLTITAQGDAPTITAIADQTTNEDTPSQLIAFSVRDNEDGAGGLAVTATSSNTTLVPNNNIFIGANDTNRTMTILPAADQSGQTTITVTVRDSTGLVSTLQFTLTVNAVNDLPTISTIANQTIPEDGATDALAFTVGDKETPISSLIFTKSSSNLQVIPSANIVIAGSGAGRTVTVTAAANKSGFADVTITVVDGNDGRSSSVFRVTVAENNDAPTITAIDDQSTAEGVGKTVNFIINDAETAASALVVTTSSSNTTLLPNANVTVAPGSTVRTLTATPVAGISGTSTITVTVTDGSGSTASDAFVLTVTEVNRNDFNGDGLSDILFQDVNGNMAAFFMNGSERIGSSFLNPNNPNDAGWKIAASGDFNGDGKGDILFQHQNGTLSVWYMDGVNLTGNTLLNPSSAGDAGWRVVAAADFNVDGKEDLLFQHSTGDLSIWYMNGITRISSTLVTPSNPGDSRWVVAAAPDVNGDSRPDIIFQHADGTLAVWYIVNAARTDFEVLNPENPGPDWRVSGTANYGQSAQSDLILQKINGDMQVWYMNGPHAEIRKLLNPVNSGADWFVVGPK